jgi:hypothetical protein
MSRADQYAQANDRWTIRLYLPGAGEPQVYEKVKHIWWSAGNTVLTILQYFEDGSCRYINWPREQVWYYTRTLERNT